MNDLVPPEVRRRWDEENEREAKLIEDMRKHFAEAIESIAEAIHSPRICRKYAENAQVSLMRALSIAAMIDPE